MNKLIKRKLLAVMLPLCILAACYKDKGSYDYHTLDEVTIDTTGIGATRSMKRFDTLTLNPVIRYKGEVVNLQQSQFPELQFSWTIYPDLNDASGNELHVLDSVPRLHKMLDQPEINWDVRLTVTNKLTGVRAFAIFKVRLEPALAEGWLVLYERNGSADVGMIVNDRINKTAVKEQVYYDIYSASNGRTIKGKPLQIAYSNAAVRPVNMYILTEQDAVSVDVNFKKKAAFADTLFWNVPSVVAPSFVQATEARRELLINNGRIHKIDYLLIVPGRQSFDIGAYNNFGTLAPWAAGFVSTTFSTVVYDQTNKRFLKLSSSGAELQRFATKQDANLSFDVDNVGLQFLYGDMGRNNEEQMIMKDPATGKHYLLTANFRLGDVARVATGKYDMSNCPEINTVNAVAAANLGEVFFYSGGTSKVYQFKYTSGVTETAWTAPANEKITHIQVQKHYQVSQPANSPFAVKNTNRVLHVATYNETTQEGKLYQMDFDPSNGAISPVNQRSYGGFGKIKSMTWKPYF